MKNGDMPYSFLYVLPEGILDRHWHVKKPQKMLLKLPGKNNTESMCYGPRPLLTLTPADATGNAVSTTQISFEIGCEISMS